MEKISERTKNIRKVFLPSQEKGKAMRIEVCVKFTSHDAGKYNTRHFINVGKGDVPVNVN